MNQSADRLTLAQWLSPAFPVGSYAYSQGLEQAITDAQVTSPETLTHWITATITHGSARMDAIFLAHARTTDGLSDLAYAYAPTAERRTEMQDQGAAFTNILATMGHSQSPLPYAIAIGQASRSLTLPTEEILALYLHALAAQLTSVAVRFIPLSAALGQKVLHDLAPLITRLAAQYAGEPLENLTSATIGADLAAMRHETLPVRIYRS